MTRVAVTAHVNNYPDDVTEEELSRALSVALRRIYVIREGHVPIPAEVQVHTIKFGGAS